MKIKILKLMKKEDVRETTRHFNSVYRQGAHREIVFLRGHRYAVISSCEKSQGKGYTTHADLRGARKRRALLIAKNIPNIVIDNEGTQFKEHCGILVITPQRKIAIASFRTPKKPLHQNS